MLPGYSDLATTDPELAQEWNAAKNTRKPTEISSLSQYPGCWKGMCGHEGKDKVLHRAVHAAGSIASEVLLLRCIAYWLLVFVIRQYDPIALATEIKQAFAKANLFKNSDSQRDVAHLRKRYFAQKNNGN